MSTHPATSPAAGEEKDSRKKRAAYVRFGLAGAALLGIAAAATSAAWTDNAWFTATATGATFEIQGKNFATTPAWVDADTKGTAIEIPAAELENLIPGETRTFTLDVRNSGSVNADVVANYAFESVTPTAVDFVADPSVSISSPTHLDAGEETTVTVTVTTDAGWAEGNQGRSENLVIVFTGTATHS
jgi:hypothetical protein